MKSDRGADEHHGRRTVDGRRKLTLLRHHPLPPGYIDTAIIDPQYRDAIGVPVGRLWAEQDAKLHHGLVLRDLTLDQGIQG